MDWKLIITLVAMLFSIVCFYLFVRNALDKPDTGEVVEQAAKKGLVANLDLNTLGTFAKAISDALSKVGPGLVALIGALLFLLIAGEAAQVLHMTGGSENKTTTNSVGGTRGGNSSAGNASGNATEPGNGSAGNSSTGNAT